ncbi:putative leucine-rich repeat-containing protein DDB_G0290503 [Diabrotica virgifera virgifera]|uniref:Leucine-rich repeat-containing protein DDB_G0290503 n=1 Tax=Diabrotica virgifera virgifera TaxID=50390 RepID=A0A6P7H2K9_DIAVI|nr:putative leucine-rich repeat-containing protein DDB_G0290503 [Diabrotica virgifera virgifera]
MQSISGKKQYLSLDTQEKNYINHAIHSNKENHFPVLNRADFLREIDEKQQHIYKIIYKAYQEIDKYKTHFIQDVPNQQKIKDNTSITSNNILKKQTDNKVRIENFIAQKYLTLNPRNIEHNEILETNKNGENFNHSTHQKSSNQSFDDVISTIEMNKQVVEKFGSIISDIRNSRETNNKISKNINWTDDIEDIEREQENNKTISGFKGFMEEILSYLVYMYHDLIGEYENCLSEVKKDSNSDNFREKYKQCTKIPERKFLQKLKITSDIIKQTFLAVTEKLVVDNVEAILKNNQRLDEHDNVLQIINELSDACEYIRKTPGIEMMFSEAQTETEYDETIGDDISDMNKLQLSEINNMFNDKYMEATENKVKHKAKILNYAATIEESDLVLNVEEINKPNQLQDRNGRDEYLNVELTSKEELLQNKQETDLIVKNESTWNESIGEEPMTMFTTTEQDNETMEATSYIISALAATEEELNNITSEGESVTNTLSHTTTQDFIMTIDTQPKRLALKTSNQQDLKKLKPQQENLKTEHKPFKPNIESTNLNETIKNLECESQKKIEKNIKCKTKLSKDEIVQQLDLIYESLKTDSQCIREQGNEECLQPITFESQIKLEKSKLIIFEQLKFLYDNLYIIYSPLYKRITDTINTEDSLRNKLFNEEHNRKYLIENKQDNIDQKNFGNQNFENQTNQQKTYMKGITNMKIINPSHKVNNVTNGVMQAQAVYQVLLKEYNDLKTKKITSPKIINIQEVPTDNKNKCADNNSTEISRNAILEEENHAKIKHDVNDIPTGSNWNNTKKQIEDELKSQLNQLKSKYQNQLHELKIQWEKSVNYLYNCNYKIEQEIINIDKKIDQLPSTDGKHVAELKASYQETKKEYKTYISKKQIELQQEVTNFEENQKQIEEKIKLLEHKINSLIQDFQQKHVQNNDPNVSPEENNIKDEKWQKLSDHEENNYQYEENSKEIDLVVQNESKSNEITNEEPMTMLTTTKEDNKVVNYEVRNSKNKKSGETERQNQVQYNTSKYLKTSNTVENSNRNRNKPLIKNNDKKVTEEEIKHDDKSNFKEKINRTYKIAKTFDGETKFKEKTNQNNKHVLKETTKTLVKTNKTLDKQSKPSRIPEAKKSLKPVSKDVDAKDLSTKPISSSKNQRAVTPSNLAQRKNISETKNNLDNKEPEKNKKLNSYIPREKSPLLGGLKQQVMKSKLYVPTKKLENNIKKRNCDRIAQNGDSEALERGIIIENNTSVNDKMSTNDKDNTEKDIDKDTEKDILIEMIKSQLQHLQDTLKMVESVNSIKIRIKNTESVKYFQNIEKEIAIVGKNLEFGEAKAGDDKKYYKNGIVEDSSKVSISSCNVEEIATAKAGRYLQRNLDQILKEFRDIETEKYIRNEISKKQYLNDDVSVDNDISRYIQDSITTRDMPKSTNCDTLVQNYRGHINDLIFDLQEDELLEKKCITPANSVNYIIPEYQLQDDIFTGSGHFVPGIPKMRQYIFGIDSIGPIGIQKDGRVTSKHEQLSNIFRTTPLDKFSQYYSDHSLYTNLKRSIGSIECVDKTIKNAEKQLQRLDEKYKIIISSNQEDNVPKKLDFCSKHLKIEKTNDILESAEKQLERLQKYNFFDEAIHHKDKCNIYITDENSKILSHENVTDIHYPKEKESFEVEDIFHYMRKIPESLKENGQFCKEEELRNVETVKSKTEIVSSLPERQTKSNRNKVKDWGDVVSNSRQSNLKRVRLPNQKLWEGKSSFDTIINFRLEKVNLSNKFKSRLDLDDTEKKCLYDENFL